MTTTDNTPTYEEVRGQLVDELKTHAEKLNELRSKKADERGDTYTADVRQAIDAIHSLDAELTARDKAAEKDIREKVEELTRSTGPIAALAKLMDETDTRSAGLAFVESEQYKEQRSGRYTPEVDVRTLLTSGTSDPGAGLWRPVGTPLPPNVRQQRLFVRDLLSVVGTTLASVPYLRELNPATNETGATAVAEGSAKAEVTMQFEQDDAPIRKIAAWIPVTEEVISDAPTLRGYIDTRLGYMLALREEAQVLNGPASSAPNIRGIRNTTGIQTQSSAGTGEMFATIGLSIGKIENVDGDADGAAVNPTDYWTAITTRHANQFDNGFGTGVPFGAPPMSPFGLRTVRTRAMESGKALVGSWRLGATLFDREQTTIRTLDQHSDYAIYNKLVILAEERVGLAVHRPDFFVLATIT